MILSLLLKKKYTFGSSAIFYNQFNTMKKLYAFIMLAAVSGNAVAQTTFEHVRTLLQANCTVGCHSGVAPSGQRNLRTLSEVYQVLVNANPVNPEADAKGMKLVDPGILTVAFCL